MTQSPTGFDSLKIGLATTDKINEYIKMLKHHLENN